ncbi:MAG: arginine--tRNA ligase [Promethearchaeati archaeon]
MIFVDKKRIAKFISTQVPYISEEEIEAMIEIPPSEINFTYAFPVFRLAKHEKKAPQQIAKQLKENLKKPEFLEVLQSDGPYLNFRVNPLLQLDLIYSMGEDYGRVKEKFNEKDLESQRIVIEYPSPNTNKPLHLGHIRNMLIGKSTSNLLEYKGNKIFQVNLNNDRGIHICKSMLAYKKFGDKKTPNKKPDHFVGDFYVKYNQLEEKDEEIIEEVQDLLQKWEEGDPEVRALWEKMNKWAVEGFQETYETFDISFDKQYFESNYYRKGKEIILNGYEKGLFVKTPDGAIKAPLKQNYGLPDKILLRSDGTSIYITQDIYLAYLKKKDFNYDASIYVVGNEQDMYFKQLFAVLDLLGFEEHKYHLSYGMIYLPEGKMKSREGTVVDADDLVDEMIKIAYEEVNSRYPNLSEKEKSERSKKIGMAALKFFILKINPKNDFIFNPEESISFEGETGPYIQYVYARIQSIIEKSKEKISTDIDPSQFAHKTELTLINQLNYFPEIVNDAAKSYDIHLIPQYLLNLGQNFNSFYNSCQVIQENKELERARLLLIKCVQIVIKIGLNLIGIDILKEM